MKFKLNAAAFTVAMSLSSSLVAGQLENTLKGSEHVLLGKDRTIIGLGGYSRFVLTNDEDGQSYLSYGFDNNVAPIAPVAISDQNGTVVLSPEGLGNSGYISIYTYDADQRALWGDEVMDQLAQAVEQGLIFEGHSFEVINGVKSLELYDYSEEESLAQLKITNFQRLVIPQYILDNLQGGWQGPDQIEALTENDPVESDLFEVNQSSLIRVNNFMQKEWALPLYGNVDFYYGTEQASFLDLSGDISDGVGNSQVFHIPFSISYGNKVVSVVSQDYTYKYLPHTISGEDIEAIVKVYEGGELKYVYSNHLVEKKSNTENFAKHLTTTFPFVQHAYINGRYADRYDEDGLLDCDMTFGYVFNADLTMNRGTYCDDRNETISLGDTRWTWQVNEDKHVTMTFVHDTLIWFRNRTWVPLSTDENGFTRVLEYSTWRADFDVNTSFEEDGYLIKPRVNLIKLSDYSQYEDFYANAGLQGDYDGDGVNDSQDTDDDNDGMSDYFENSYSLNHLDASDASDDGDFDGLTNLQESRRGSDPSNGDTDGDGVPDNRDIEPNDPSVTSNQRVIASNYFGDINDDRVWDWYIASQYDNGYELSFYSGMGGEFLKTISLYLEYTDAEIVHLDDINGDGIDEIGLFGFVPFTGENENLRKAQLFVADPVTGERVVVHNWPGNWSDVSFFLANDANNDGIRDVAIQGKFKDGDRPQLFVKDAVSGERLTLHAYPSIYADPVFNWFGDFDNDDVQDIILLGTKSNGKIQARVSSGVDGSKLGSYNFPANYSDISWRSAGDVDNDGIFDFGLLGKRLDDGRVQLFTKSGVSPAGTLGIFSWPSMTDFELFRVKDLNGDNQREFALVGFREETGRYQMIVKDGRDRNNTLSNSGWPDNWDNVSFEYMIDIDRDEARSTEIALLGRRKTNGAWQMAIRSTTGADLGQIELGNEWDSKPGYRYSLSNGVMTMFLYGEANGASITKTITHSFNN
jgi:hypothetical protein